MKLSVIIIGGLSNGYIVYNYLKKNKYVDLKLVLTYPDENELPRHYSFPDEANIIKTNSAIKYKDKIIEISPDYIFVVGWSEILDSDIINSAQKMVIGFHPSKLPADRGRSVLAWQIEDGYTETALTMFRYSTYPDGGDIIAQESIKIDYNDYLNDILEKVDAATLNMMKAYFPLIRKDLIVPRKQELSEGNFRRLRNNDDSRIDWNRPAVEIFNKIRAISKPYPGAITVLENRKIRIWRSRVIENFEFSPKINPGDIAAKIIDNTIIVKCRNEYLHITEYDYE